MTGKRVHIDDGIVSGCVLSSLAGFKPVMTFIISPPVIKEWK
ncbi:MAG: hypothetical protein ACTSXP_06960 [Promethearchaeota archaeon]